MHDNFELYGLEGGVEFNEIELTGRKVAEAEHKRVERGIRGAIRAGYDGVDIQQPRNMARSFPVSRIKPWNYPEPPADVGVWTERYTWDWFSDDELAEILTHDDPLSVLNNSVE